MQDALFRELIKKLLVQDRTKRLGNMKAGAEDVKKHRLPECPGLPALPPRWFKSLDWEEVYHRQLKPPIVPKVDGEGDTCNFDDYPEVDTYLPIYLPTHIPT